MITQVSGRPGLLVKCIHKFVPSDKRGYEVCSSCGTYHSLTAPPAEQLYTTNYWGSAKHGTIEDHRHNVEGHLEHGVCKNQFVQQQIVVEDKSAALEIGCAPGCLLKRLEEQNGFEHVFGIEMDATCAESIFNETGDNCDLHFGIFPACTDIYANHFFSLIIGLDVFEHSHEPEAFLKECFRLLKPNGQLILMLPLLKHGETLDDRFFDPIEHVFMHSRAGLYPLMRDCGFREMYFSRWTMGHDTVSARIL